MYLNSIDWVALPLQAGAAWPPPATLASFVQVSSKMANAGKATTRTGARKKKFRKTKTKEDRQRARQIKAELAANSPSNADWQSIAEPTWRKDRAPPATALEKYIERHIPEAALLLRRPLFNQYAVEHGVRTHLGTTHAKRALTRVRRRLTSCEFSQRARRARIMLKKKPKTP